MGNVQNDEIKLIKKSSYRVSVLGPSSFDSAFIVHSYFKIMKGLFDHVPHIQYHSISKTNYKDFEFELNIYILACKSFFHLFN